MTPKLSADRYSHPISQIAQATAAFVDLQMRTMTVRTTVVTGALLGSLVPLAQVSYEHPAFGVAIAIIAPTRATRNFFRRLAGLGLKS